MYTVRVTIPGHRTTPGLVIAQYNFRDRDRAESYAEQVRGHYTGAYGAEVVEGRLPAFDVCAGDD